MNLLRLRSALGFVFLATAIFIFRAGQGGTLGFVFSTAVVVLFWAVHQMRFAFSSIRSLLLMLGVLSLGLIAFRLTLPLINPMGETGWWQGGDLNPGTIAQLKSSHKTALELNFDHRPTDEERYYRVGVLQQTDDGIHYTNRNVKFLPARAPETLEWTKVSLLPGHFSENLKRIESWWRKDFSYSLSPGVLSDEHPLDDFLFNGKKGFCEHYSAALATLLNLSGVRARVVVGFYGGSWSAVLRRLTFEEADAHAWVEAVEPSSQRWRTIDPTLWVSSDGDVNRPSASLSVAKFFLTILIFIVVILFLYQRKDPVEKFVDKLSRFEKRTKLSGVGLTITERVTRFAEFRPKEAELIQESLRIYYQVYFQGEPTERRKKMLAQSLSRW